MRVVIIGLLPAQAQLIKSEFRGLDLRIFHKDTRESAHAVAAAADKADRVLLMTRFVGHKVTERLNKRNVTPINGAMTALRDALKMLDAPAPGVPAPTRAPPLLPPPHTPLAPLLMAQKQNDFSAIKNADPGSVLAFKRPHNVTKEAFEKQVAGARSHYKRTHNVITSMEWAGDEIHVLIEAQLPKAPDKDIVTDVAAPATKATDTLPPATRGGWDDKDRDFWKEVYLQAQRANPGFSPHDCALQANGALDALYAKFGSTP